MNERDQFEHGWPHWPVRVVTCPRCGATMQTDASPRDDGRPVCPDCYTPADPEEDDAA